MRVCRGAHHRNVTRPVHCTPDASRDAYGRPVSCDPEFQKGAVLFDLATDPRETQNIAATHPDGERPTPSQASQHDLYWACCCWEACSDIVYILTSACCHHVVVVVVVAAWCSG